MLTERMVLCYRCVWCYADGAYGATHRRRSGAFSCGFACPMTGTNPTPTRLRSCYAVPGTGVPHGTTRSTDVVLEGRRVLGVAR
eukprot:2293598-Rhodomonas_salina.1